MLLKDGVGLLRQKFVEVVHPPGRSCAHKFVSDGSVTESNAPTRRNMEFDMVWQSENRISYETIRCEATRSFVFAANRCCASSKTFVQLP